MQTGKTFSTVALLVMMGLLLLLWASCNPYKKLVTRPPLTTKDSAALLARCIQILPVDTAQAILPPIRPQEPDSTDYFRKLSDSLAGIKMSVLDSILIQYKDTCRSVVDQYKKGFDLGYQVGDYEGRSSSETKAAEQRKKAAAACDSSYQVKINELIRAYNLRLTAAEVNANLAIKNANKYRGKMDFWKTWALIASCLALVFLIIAIILWKFRRQASAANKVINQARDVGDQFKKIT